MKIEIHDPTLEARIQRQVQATGSGKTMTRWIALWALFIGTAAAQSVATGTLSGRLRLPDNSVLGGIRVAAMSVPEVAVGGNAAAKSVLASIALTDNDGNFRLDDVPPGRYYLVVGPLKSPVYYPGVTTADAATVLTVSAGSALDRMEFSLLVLRDLSPASIAANFDISKAVLMEGTVTVPSPMAETPGALIVLADVNEPMTGLGFNVVKIVNWTIFLPRGSQRSLRQGDRITFFGFPAKDGKSRMVVDGDIEVRPVRTLRAD